MIYIPDIKIFKTWIYDDVYLPIKWKIKNLYREFKMKYFVKRNVIKTTLDPKKYHDLDEVLLYTCMGAVMEFVNEEDGLQTTEWNHSIASKTAHNKIVEIKNWWGNYENRLDEIDSVINDWSNLSDQLIEYKDNKSVYKIVKGDCDYLFDTIDYLDKKLKIEETQMLKKVIEVRSFLWT